MDDTIACKYCSSTNLVKFGTFKGIQRYWCKGCKRKFADNDAVPKMKTPAKIVSAALSCYFDGMPLDAIQRHLQQQFGTYFSEMGIYNWVIRFAEEAIDRVKDFQPVIGDTWIANETCLTVEGKHVWFWDILDVKTRYLLASRLSNRRTIEDAALLMIEAKRRAGKIPKRIITNKLAAYIDGIERVFGADTEHIQSKPIVSEDSTNIIENFRSTLKDRTKKIRGFWRMDSARLLTEAWLVHYNFFKGHNSLGDTPPAINMGATPVKDWVEVVTGTKTIPSLKSRVRLTKRIMLKRRPPKRKPSGLKQGALVEVTLTKIKGK